MSSLEKGLLYDRKHDLPSRLLFGLINDAPVWASSAENWFTVSIIQEEWSAKNGYGLWVVHRNRGLLVTAVCRTNISISLASKTSKGE